MISQLKNRLLSLLPSKSNKWQNLIFIACAVLFFAYCFSIPTFSNRYPFNYLSIALCALMCGGMLLYAFLYGTIKLNVLIMILVLFNISTFITHIFNGNLSTLPKTIILMTIVAFCLYQFISSYSKKNLFIYLLLLAGLSFAIVYIIHYRSALFDLKNIFNSRLGIDFDNENEISKELGFFCVTALALGIKNKKLLIKISFFALTLLFLFLVLSTGSISNLFTTILVCLLVLILCQPTIKRKVIFGAVVLGFIAIFVIILQFPFLSYFKTRIESIFNTLFGKDKTVDNIDYSANDRLIGALTSFKISLNKIIFGFGYMSATRFTPFNIQAHNNFAELLIDFGLSGFVCYEFLIILPIWKGFNKQEYPHIVSIMLYMLLFQFFLTTYYKKFEYIFFACIYAILDNEFKIKYLLWDSSKLQKSSGKTVIFEVIPSLNPVGGAESFVTSFSAIVKEKYDKDVDIKVICLYKQPDSELLRKLKRNGIEVYELDKQSGLDIGCACRFRELVYKYNPNIIHTHLYSLTTLKIALPLKRKSIKLYHTIHHNLSKTGKGQKMLKRLTKSGYLTPVCVAKLPCEQYSSWFEKDVNFINNGIELTCFNDTKPLKDRNIDFLCVGRFVPIKNQNYLINLYKNNEELRGHTLVFLGDGPSFDSLKEKVDRFGLQENITFKGSVDNVNEYMSNSKVLVMPSLNEGNPMVINEAFASGMAVVGNDVGGIHDLLSEVDIGGLAKISNPKLFERIMLNTLDDVNKLNESIKYDKTKFDMSVTVDKYLSLFGVIKS